MNSDSTQRQQGALPPALETVVVTRERELVDGFRVRRALPSARRRMVGPFIFLDQMGPEVLGAGRGLDVAPHPHIGLATVTHLFAGELLHRSAGIATGEKVGSRGGGRSRTVGRPHGTRPPPPRHSRH